MMKTLNSEALTQSGKASMNQDREYCSDKAKASAFCRNTRESVGVNQAKPPDVLTARCDVRCSGTAAH